uniref:ATP synthase subunit a n=1 Tax=Echinorhynchus truttae TaxID=185727 RepID=K0JA04_9BILA|nr:ATP synthase F0 subunit 6 [Echinorhynchus truttae]CCA94458.1 ATP synthase F0 subunit 6 [Echinorhynchus truttae]
MTTFFCSVITLVCCCLFGGIAGCLSGSSAWGLIRVLGCSLLGAGLGCLSVAFVWLSSNVSGLVVGTGYSMGYGLVMIVGLSMWVWGVVLTVYYKNLCSYISHFAIVGVSGILGLILPVLELFSVAIRPLTLSVRLATNISSGHVMLLMLALFSSGGFLGLLLLVSSVVLVMLEFLVGVLQAAIFSMLVATYM